MTMPEFPADFPPGTGLVHLTETASTNDEARRLFALSADTAVWIMADRQTAGRGRMGRGWSSPEGNLMASLMCRPACGISLMGQLGFVAGLAVQSAIAEMSGLVAKLKWPNDVLIEGAKCAGILLETLSPAPGREAGLCIGIGVNLQYHPTDTPYPATSLKAAAGTAPSRRGLLAVLARNFETLRMIWQDQGFKPIRQMWLENAHGLGREITVALPQEKIAGKFRDIDEEGRLLLEKSDGKTRPVAAGDVFFGSTGDTGND